jgi:TolA-binding protein
MSILIQKLFRRLQEEQSAEGGAGGGGDHDTAVTREQEIQASRMGWIPKHKYKGPEGQWKDAATFLADGARFNNRLQSELADVKQQLTEFKGTAKQFSEFQQRQIEQRDTEIQSLVRDLKRQQREAVRSGDDTTADAIDDRIEILTDEQRSVKATIEKAKQTPTTTTAPQVIDENGNSTHPVVNEWIEDGNQWVRDNKFLRDSMFVMSGDLIQSGETRRGRAFLDLLTQKMKESFPKRFANISDPTARGSMTESGSSRSGGESHTEHDLPEEDLALMKLGIRQGWTTKDTFLKNYFSDAPRKHSTPEKKKS